MSAITINLPGPLMRAFRRFRLDGWTVGAVVVAALVATPLIAVVGIAFAPDNGDPPGARRGAIWDIGQVAQRRGRPRRAIPTNHTQGTGPFRPGRASGFLCVVPATLGEALLPQTRKASVGMAQYGRNMLRGFCGTEAVKGCYRPHSVIATGPAAA